MIEVETMGVRESLSAVSVKQMKTWVAEKLGTTLASKRAIAYREFTATIPNAEVPQSGDATTEETSPSSSKNRRNGYSSKTIQGDMGKLPLEIPRDRNGSFEPQLIGKHQRRIPGFDENLCWLSPIEA
jgi:transposase-like protein